MSPVVVHNAHPSAVPQVMAALASAGLHAVALDQPDPTVLYASGGTYLIRIAVPPEEAEPARAILAEMEQASEPTVRTLDRRLKQAFLAGLGAAGVAAVLFRLFLGSGEEVPWVLVAAIGAAALLLVANTRRPQEPPTSRR